MVKILLALAFASALSAADTAPPWRIRVHLERRQATGWKGVDPAIVLNSKDQVRFRLKSSLPGYLYVLDRSTSGTFTQLFPTPESGRANRIVADQEYMVPATAGAFRVDGPAGFDVIYWLISPVELRQMPSPDQFGDPEAAPARDIRLLPRCNDGILKARGECVDLAAGAHALADPGQVAATRDGVRELTFIREHNASLVTAPPTGPGPLVYEFRLAHQ